MLHYRSYSNLHLEQPEWYRKLADGRIIKISPRHMAFRLATEGRTTEEIMAATGLTRKLAAGYRGEALAQQRYGTTPVPRDIVIQVPPGALDAAGVAALADYLQNQCVAAFVASRVKSDP